MDEKSKLEEIRDYLISQKEMYEKMSLTATIGMVINDMTEEIERLAFQNDEEEERVEHDEPTEAVRNGQY